MFKMKVTMRASIQAVIDTTTDFDRRMKWDNKLYDVRVIYESSCKCYRRMYFAFRAPPAVADRDFYLEQHVKHNFPKPGMFSLFAKSLPANYDESPENPKRVRGNLIIVGFIFKPRFDEDLQMDVTDVFHVTCLDIMGSFPKWMINALAKSVPKSWFALFEKETQRYQ